MLTKVAIVDDNEEIRSEIVRLLKRAEGFKLIGEFANGEIALKRIPDLQPDVVLMDINLPGMKGFECVRRIKALRPAIQFLMLTVHDDGESLFSSLRAGASGYLLKRTAIARLLEAIQDVYNGGAPMTPQLARRVVQFFSQPATGSTPLAKITPAERLFLDQLASGYAYKEIADRMNISIDTVRSHVRAVYEKLHVHSRTEAVVKYLRG
jgi:DNA-binding NarL/FixJ family response regulator